MYAYCANNPVTHIDPTGTISVIAILTAAVVAVLLTSCGKSPAEVPADYIVNDDHNIGACYEYAGEYIGIGYTCPIDPGTYHARKYGNGSTTLPRNINIDQVAYAVSQDLEAYGFEYTCFDSYGDIPAETGGKVLIAAFTYPNKDNAEVDYHFAIQLSDGTWADKPGLQDSRYGILHFDGAMWTDNQKISADASDTVFFLITRK